MPLKYVGQHVSYLLASCQMNCIIPIWSHMCMGARSASNRCCRNALDRDIDSKVICETQYAEYQQKVTLACPGCYSTKNKGPVLIFPGRNRGIRLRMKTCKEELGKLKSGKRDGTPSEWHLCKFNQMYIDLGCCSASSCVKICFFHYNRVRNVKYRDHSLKVQAIELKLFCEGRGILYYYYCILHLLQCFQGENK